jgi:hypothetical protein
MKFLWRDPWICHDLEDWDFGLMSFGIQRFRHKPPQPDDEARSDGPLPSALPETPEDGFIEVVMPLEAKGAEAAKQEAARSGATVQHEAVGLGASRPRRSHEQAGR